MTHRFYDHIIRLRQQYYDSSDTGMLGISFMGDTLMYIGLGRWTTLLDVVEDSAMRGAPPDPQWPPEAKQYHDFLTSKLALEVIP